MSDVLIKAEGVSKKFCKNIKRSMLYGIQDIFKSMFGLTTKTDILREKEFWAVDDISFELKRGECLGLIGPNGSGKSTLLKILNGIIEPDKGRIQINGKVGALIEVGAGFHPMLTGRENIYINGSILGFSKKELDEKFDAIVDFAELEDFIDTPVKHYSSGMYVRLGFAIAAQMEPDVLLIDEVLAVGDIGFRHKCHNIIMELTQKCAVIVVSHSIPSISRISTDILVLSKGEKMYLGKDVSTGVEKYCAQFPVEKISCIGKENVLLNSVNVLSAKSNGNAIKYLDDFVLDIEFTVLKEKCTDVLCIEIFDNESSFIAECFIDISKKNITTNKTTIIKAIIPKIQLCSGKYFLTIIFCKKINNKPNGKFISQYRSVVSFNVKDSTAISHAPFLLTAKIIETKSEDQLANKV